MAKGCPVCGINGCPVNANCVDPKVEFNSSQLMRFDRLQQGKFYDCWFVAALSSYLFIEWPLAPQSVYTFQFFNNNEPVIINTSGKVCVENKISTIYGAKEIFNNKTYSWPAVYEKAYVAFLENPGTPPDPPHMLNYIQMIGGNPLDCLEKLSGGIAARFLTSEKTADEIFLIVKNLSNSLGASYSVSKPFVAFTGSSTNTELGLKINHSYSILGLYQSEIIYLILRDPDVANCKAYKQNITWQYVDKETWQVTNVDCGIDNNKGIFAIKVEDFKNAFAGFGYVQ